jgi:hypothetical protein
MSILTLLAPTSREVELEMLALKLPIINFVAPKI